MDKKRGTSVLLIFTRVPMVGMVKTRLIPELGSEKATELYISLVHHTFNFAKDAGFDQIQVWLAGDESEDQSENRQLTDWKRKYNFSFFNQQGSDLGERMFNAFTHALEQFEQAVIIGCDSPELNADILSEASRILKQDNMLVLGPCEDGGYYLLGLNRVHLSLFSHIPWGSDCVADMTRKRADKLDLEIHEMELLWDVDRPEDIQRLRQLNGFCSIA